MLKATIYDDQHRPIGSFENDTLYNESAEIIGYRSGDTIVDSLNYGKILYRIHEDGTITENTSQRIVARITDDGTILEGTTCQIKGHVKPEELFLDSHSSSNSLLFIIIAAFFGAALLYFAIFKLPEVVAMLLGSYWRSKDYVNLISFAGIILLVCLSCVAINLFLSKTPTNFSNRFSTCFGGSFVICMIGSIFSLLILTEQWSFWDIIGTILGVPIVSAVLCLLPSLMISVIFHLISFLK